MAQEAKKGFSSPAMSARSKRKLSDEILLYGYVKPWDQWFLTEGTPRPTPTGSPGGSPRPQALDRRHARARALAPARLATPAKARAQEDRPRATKAWGLLDAALQVWRCQPLP
jgi:hypothetical protein